MRLPRPKLSALPTLGGLLERTADHHRQLRRLDGGKQEGMGSGLHASFPGMIRLIRSAEKDDRDGTGIRIRLEPPADFVTVKVGQIHVKDDDGRVLLRDEAERVGAAMGLQRAKTV